MLALTVELDGRVFLDVGGERIVVQVIRFKGSRVVLGFEAPQQVKILREEIAEGSVADGR